MSLWLASGSPRRRQLLEWAGIDVSVNPTEVDEAWMEGEHPTDAAQRLATEKALGPADRVVLAADTVVHLADAPYGKPMDAADASRMLTELSGRWHQVTTGVAIRYPQGLHCFGVTTEVRFRTLTAHEITRYVQTGEPMDKAGAYAIQGIGGVLVAEVRGSWTNVMGLPMERTLEALRSCGVEPR